MEQLNKYKCRVTSTRPRRVRTWRMNNDEQSSLEQRGLVGVRPVIPVSAQLAVHKDTDNTQKIQKTNICESHTWSAQLGFVQESKLIHNILVPSHRMTRTTPRRSRRAGTRVTCSYNMHQRGRATLED
ncbi:hypothetical protein KGM_202857 [Danaus plexippus plexippus]|uniref:Uncharacterized protein n=1 Tax=Danaus plexippus plexippus TaxID=278856 RepID=A0A212F223_DANPL|nr:hypothetical protein KGM_202857 [Danaus plexippus plexippus]